MDTPISPVPPGSSPDPDEAYVEATVVRAQAPTSARPGDRAVVRADGTIDGFIGGQCVETSVTVAAAEILQSGETMLLRVLPEGALPFPDVEGARTVVNPCLSGGAMEIFLDPRTPAPTVALVGGTPIVKSLEALLPQLGMQPASDATVLGRCVGVVIATHGHQEEETIRAALDAGVPYIGMIASPRRAGEVLGAMDLAPEERALVRSPAGIDIGAKTSAEIGLSVAAELVEAIRRGGIRPASTPVEVLDPATAIDPICGMTVTVTDGTPHVRVDGTDHWFCCPGCRTTFQEQLHGAA